MAATIILSSVSLASDGVTFTGTLSGGTGTGYTPASGVRNFTITVDGVTRNLCASTISGTTWTGTAYTPIKSTQTVTVVAATGTGAQAGMTYLTDSGGNTATAQSYSVTNNSTKTQADVVAALRSKPSGWDSVWAAARSGAASALAEVNIFGDSTTYGAGASNTIAWPYRMRAHSVAAGIADGGQGLIYVSIAETNGWKGVVEDQNPVASGSWTNLSNVNFFGPALVGGSYSDTASQTITLQGRGTRARLYYAIFSTVGDFTYSVDGGAAVTVNAFSDAGANTGVVDIALGSDTLHTITLTNVGSRAQPAPVWNNSGVQNAAGTGTLAAGTYRYAITAVDASANETLATLGTAFAVGTGGRSTSMSIRNTSTGLAYVGTTATKYNLYRSFNSGVFQFLTQITIAGSTNSYTDTGSITPTSTEPPTVATFTRDTGTKNAGVSLEFIRSTGVVYHKDAVTGATFNTFGLDGAAYTNYPHQIPLGLTHTQPSSTTPATRPPWRIPKLSVCALGINNQQSGQSSTTLVTNGVTTWATASAGAGASRLLVIPHYSRSNSFTTGKAFVDAMKTYANANGIAWFDFNVALDLANFGGGSDPHLAQSGYDAEAKAIWDVMIGPAAYTLAVTGTGLSATATITRNSGLTFLSGETVSIDWGDGTTSTISPTAGGTTGSASHTYSTAGSKTVTPTSAQGWTDDSAKTFSATAPPTVSPSVASQTNTTATLNANVSVVTGTPTYAWTATTKPSGAVPLFSPSGTTTGSVANPVVTFDKAGSYVFTLNYSDDAGTATAQTVGVTVSQVQASVTISPSTATVVTGQTQTFTSTAVDQFGASMTPATPVYSVESGVGTINSSTGVYTAGSTPGSAIVRSTSGGFTSDATATVRYPYATTYTLTGPTTAIVGSPSGAFTVSLPSSTGLSGNVVVTPAVSGVAGTFSPATVTLSTSITSQQFTFTASGAGTASVSVTNNGGLTNPASLTGIVVSAASVADGFTTTDRANLTLALSTLQTLATGFTNGTFIVDLRKINGSASDLTDLVTRVQTAATNSVSIKNKTDTLPDATAPELDQLVRARSIQDIIEATASVDEKLPSDTAYRIATLPLTGTVATTDDLDGIGSTTTNDIV